LCKRSEPGYGFKTQGPTTVPIEYFNSTFVSKYIWEVAGQQAPTHRALRVAPLSVLFAILDDAVYRALCLFTYVLNVTCAPMHSYELHQRVAALGFMTRLEALRRLRFETKAALDGSGGERTVSRVRLTTRDANAYAEKLIAFKDTYVSKKTWAVINAFSRVGGKQVTSVAKSDSGTATPTAGVGLMASLWEEAVTPAPESQVVIPQGRARGRGQPPGRGRVYRGGRGPRGAFYSTIA